MAQCASVYADARLVLTPNSHRPTDNGHCGLQRYHSADVRCPSPTSFVFGRRRLLSMCVARLRRRRRRAAAAMGTNAPGAAAAPVLHPAGHPGRSADRDIPTRHHRIRCRDDPSQKVVKPRRPGTSSVLVHQRARRRVGELSRPSYRCRRRRRCFDRAACKAFHEDSHEGADAGSAGLAIEASYPALKFRGGDLIWREPLPKPGDDLGYLLVFGWGL